MKRSEFNKELSVTGKNGVITGNIRVVMNHGNTTIKWTNPSSHEQEDRIVDRHLIEAYIGDTLWWKNFDLVGENIVLSEVERCKKQMTDEMTRMANDEPIKSFADKFKEI